MLHLEKTWKISALSAFSAVNYYIAATNFRYSSNHKGAVPLGFAEHAIRIHEAIQFPGAA